MDLFERFWQVYPIKRDKKAARAQWTKVVGADAELGERLVADVERRRAEDDQWLRGFAVYAHRYLRDHRWEDELHPATAPVARRTVASAQAAAAAAHALIAEKRKA